MSGWRNVRSWWCVVLVLLASSATSAHAEELIPQAKVDAIVKPLVDGGWIKGLAIGFVTDKGQQTLGYGAISDTNPAAPTPETLFEIGSITKTFTGIILAQMVEEGTVKLDDRAQALLGMTLMVPVNKERPITLVDLATHSSGLPRMPSNFSPKDPQNPYADYTVAQMGQFLMRHKLQRKPGEKSEYSNLGMGLLGHILQLKSGYDYESLVEKVITGPLEMTHTRITLDEDDLARLAQGHDSDGQPAKNWDLPTLAGAGAIRSTSGDMLKYVAANVGLRPSKLDKAIALSQQVHFKNPDDAGGDVGLGWQLQRVNKLVWHNGGTGGYSSFIGMQPEKKIGVVVLGNSSSDYVTQLGFRLVKLLGGDEVKPFSLPTNIKLAQEKLEPLVGKYRMSPIVVAEVTREGDQLFIQLTGQPRIGIYPTSDTNFYCRPVDAKFDFEADDSGKFTKMVIHQNGLDIPCTRMEADAQGGKESSADEPKEKTPAGS